MDAMTDDIVALDEAAPSGPLYRLDNVSRTFRAGGVEVRAVDGVTLDIGSGEFVAVEGPSGSGKSTLLQLLGGLDKPTGGLLEFAGTQLNVLDDTALTEVRSAQIGFVFQHFNLIPTLTALENVEVAMVPLQKDKHARRARASALLEQIGLSARAHHLPSRLSGGEQQRVAIARAMANRPRVILADEPTGNLDSATAVEVVDALEKLSADQGVTVIIVTHAEHVAVRAHRRLKMRDGRLGEGLVDPPANAPSDES